MRPAGDVCGVETVAEEEATSTGAAVTETLELLLLDISCSKAKTLCSYRRLNYLTDCTVILNLAINANNFEPVLRYTCTLHNSEPKMHCILLVVNASF